MYVWLPCMPSDSCHTPAGVARLPILLRFHRLHRSLALSPFDMALVNFRRSGLGSPVAFSKCTLGGDLVLCPG